MTGCALMLTSCAVSSPLAVESTGQATAGSAVQNVQIAISIPEGSAQTLKTRFAAALVTSLSNRGIAVSPDGVLVADYAVSTGPAAVGLQSSQGGSSDGQAAPVWIAPPRPARRFDECEAMVMRGSLLLLDRNTGVIAYRGTGTMTDCEFGEDALRAMADGLIADYAAGDAAR